MFGRRICTRILYTELITFLILFWREASNYTNRINSSLLMKAWLGILARKHLWKYMCSISRLNVILENSYLNYLKGDSGLLYYVKALLGMYWNDFLIKVNKMYVYYFVIIGYLALWWISKALRFYHSSVQEPAQRLWKQRI